MIETKLTFKYACLLCRALGTSDLARISVTGARAAYEKHKDTAESKGVKAHFHLDDSSLITLDRVNRTKKKIIK